MSGKFRQTTLQVQSASNLTPNMRRITLSGEGLKNFPKNAEGAYVKLLFPSLGAGKPTMRTYTIALQRYEQNEIDIDFMLHKDENDNTSGIAVPWSLSAKIGDEIAVAGPGPAKMINQDADYFLLAADMTALPALAANLKRLPADAVGQAFIEIQSADDTQVLEKPKSVEISWVVNDSPGSNESPLHKEIAQAAWPEGSVAAWVACEFTAMRKIRTYLKNERGLAKSHIYISSYWKLGNTEEQHKATKQQDAKTA